MLACGLLLRALELLSDSKSVLLLKDHLIMLNYVQAHYSLFSSPGSCNSGSVVKSVDT